MLGYAPAVISHNGLLDTKSETTAFARLRFRSNQPPRFASYSNQQQRHLYGYASAVIGRHGNTAITFTWYTVTSHYLYFAGKRYKKKKNS